ncbi:hypothetical protein BGX21_010757 [Mortierella sp. AD011]|nr:hypothetical protein BGX20_005439 [Mortierella sp. AD010]KAF9402253.1 hypothetical protein BGX21_010757 [Mortierella sp. AD011]
MSKFYTPMNPTYHVPQPQSENQSTTTTASTPSLGPGAALLLANLTTIPGFLSDTVIQEVRQEYTNQQQQQQQQQQQRISQGQPSVASTTSVPISAGPHPPPVPINGTLTDPSAKIGSLLLELQQTGQHPSSQPSWPQSNITPVPPITSQASVAPSTPPPPQPPHQASEPLAVEDYSNGKITPQLLKRLASIAESDAQQGGALLKEIKVLRERQIKAEKSLFEKREALLAKHKRDLMKLQASEIMGINVTSQTQQTKAAHMEELKQFDKNVVYELDKEITVVQRSLSKSGVPMMSCTSDPTMISSQIRVLRLLEDMLQS